MSKRGIRMNKEQIVYKKTSELQLNARNPRKNDEAVDTVAKSIQEFGFKNPLIVDSAGTVWCGNTRLKAARKLGIEEVPCIVADDLTEEQIRKLALIDNKSSEIAEWDFELLKDELADLDMDEFDLDWGIDEALGIEKEVEEDNFDVDSAIPDEPKAKYGDIYQLGEHRLMCGDSTKEEDVAKLMDGKLADLLFTDPPYNVSMESKSKEILKSENYSHIENDDLPLEEFEEFLGNVFVNANNSLKDNASYYVFSCQGGDNELMMMMMRQSGIKCRHQIIWVKDAPVFSMGRLDYDYKHEPILYGWKKRHNFYRNGEQDKSVWEFKRTANKLHPTMKPIELIANALQNSTKQNDLVLDLFGGSGSTLIACEQLDRECYMMELDPHYADVIIKRWEDFTGKKAVKIN